MTILRHPDSGKYWLDDEIHRHATLVEPFQTFEEAVEELEDDGFVRVWPEDFDSGESVLMHALVEGVVQIAVNTSRSKDSKMQSPYYTKEEAAAYLRTTVDGIYGRVERGQLERCPGSREYLFTKEMLDKSVTGQVKRPMRRRQGR